MKTLIAIVGVIMILEGIPYFTMPNQVRGVAAKILTMESRSLRLIGFGLMMGGLITVALTRI